MVSREAVYNAAYKVLVKAATSLPAEVVESIKEAEARETNPFAKAQIQTIMKNIDVSREDSLSICQDPGIPVFRVGIGSKMRIDFDLKPVLAEALAEVTRQLPLRQNIVHPLTKQNPGTNTGWDIPFVFYDYLYGQDYLELVAMFRGGGAAFRSSVVSLAPTTPRLEGIKKTVFDFVAMAGGIPCPPTVVGVGIGGTPDIALHLAFEGLRRRPVGAHNADPIAAKMEEDLLAALNNTGIGTMGMGGTESVLGVHVEFCGAHTATSPVATAFSCWPNRYAIGRIYASGQWEWITHRGEGE